MREQAKNQKVFVGISGGVDSSVSAYLLKQAGYDVHGVFIKTWSPEWLPCTWLSEKRDAMRICAALDIPFHFLDATEEYKTTVADYMIAEYKSGRTPNPDVLCNREIKFGAMWQFAKAHGADALATGHYAQTDGKALRRATDEAKDQSYFLWMLTPNDLAHVQFPIGHLQKEQVRAIAKHAGLFTATKKDSQGICFLGDVDMREFLSHYITETPGHVVTTDGVHIGTHTGIVFYTLGERHGFTITEKTAERRPYYVVGKDIEKNQLIVSHEPVRASAAKTITITLRTPNWIVQPSTSTPYTAQIRYHGTHLQAQYLTSTTLSLTTDSVIALGQSIVLYDNDTLIGGGVIDQIL